MKINMNDNFSQLKSRVYDSIHKTNLTEIYDILSSITEPTLVSGVGGSSVVSLFLSKILSIKNHIICENVTARDLIYKNLIGFANIIACSYSGSNFGVVTSFNNHLNKYLLSRRLQDGVTNIHYTVTDVEESFISLSSTLIPMTILLAYYLDNDIEIIKEILDMSFVFDFDSSNIYEVLTGFDTNVASKFIESTLTEAGIGIPILHDKYDYCHGRSTLGFHYSSNVVFFNMYTELDNLYKNIISDSYKNVIQIDKKYKDNIINDYYFTYLSMYLCKSIAEQRKRDLSIVDYSPLVKKLYYFKGEM